MPIPFRPSGDTSRRLAGLASLVESGREIQLDMAEELLLLAAGGVIADATGLIQVDTLSAIRRQATRHDLLGRLLRGREFAIDLRGRVTLSEMASIACLSPYHFLRLFKSAFRETPMVFARRVRLQRGLDRIARGASASEAARAAGFASSSTFLRARRRSGSRRDQGMNDPRSS